MSGFTPAPWRIETTDRTQGDWKWREIVAADPDEGNHVVLGEVYVDGSGYPFDDHAEANARLIAAAPELYEALELCVIQLERQSKSTWGLDADEAHRLDVSRAALAKARGEQA